VTGWLPPVANAPSSDKCEKNFLKSAHLLSLLWYAKNRIGRHVRQSQDEILERPPVTTTVSRTGMFFHKPAAGLNSREFS